MNVNDYVRTKTGIHKIFRINEDATVWKYHCDKKPTGEWDSSYEYIKIRESDIIKSSPNIIDLIEVGDYVNGRKVVDKQYHYTDKDNYDMGEWCIFYENVALGDYQYDVKSIVTKEQFESMEYKL